MKLIIAGSRGITSKDVVRDAFLKWHNSNRETIVSQIVSGGAKSVDQLGEQVASQYHIKTVVFKADWNKFGKSAGIKRNEHMGQYADALLAIWDGESRGTKHMINYMKSLGKPVYVEIIK